MTNQHLNLSLYLSQPKPMLTIFIDTYLRCQGFTELMCVKNFWTVAVWYLIDYIFTGSLDYVLGLSWKRHDMKRLSALLALCEGNHQQQNVCKSLLSLRWRHNGRDGVSNHQSHDCLLNRLFRRKSKKTSKLRVTGLCAGNSPGTGEFPAQMASNTEKVSI